MDFNLFAKVCSTVGGRVSASWVKLFLLLKLLVGGLCCSCWFLGLVLFRTDLVAFGMVGFVGMKI